MLCKDIGFKANDKETVVDKEFQDELERMLLYATKTQPAAQPAAQRSRSTGAGRPSRTPNAQNAEEQAKTREVA